jgi:hypothetical protein
MPGLESSDQEFTRPGYLELTGGQLGVWHAQRLNSDASLYNAAQYWDIHGPLDVDVFTKALHHVIAETGAYNLRFHGSGDKVRQRVDKRDDWPLHVADVSSVPDPSAAAENWMRADMRSPVDLQDGPHFIMALFRVGPERFFWYQRMHHVVIDGFGVAVVDARVAWVYRSLLTGGSPEDGRLEPFPVLVDAELAYRASQDSRRDREFWLAASTDFPEPVSLSRSS